MLAFHGTRSNLVDSILRDGLLPMNEAKRDWGTEFWASGKGVYLSSTPKLALTTGGIGCLVVCDVDTRTIAADEDMISALLRKCMLKAAKTHGIHTEHVDDAWGGFIEVVDMSALLAFRKREPGALEKTIANLAEKALRKQSSSTPDANTLFAAAGSYLETTSMKLVDDERTPEQSEAIRRTLELVDGLCMTHGDFGSSRKNWTFRVLDPIGFEGESRIVAILSGKKWLGPRNGYRTSMRLVAGELDSDILLDIGKSMNGLGTFEGFDLEGGLALPTASKLEL